MDVVLMYLIKESDIIKEFDSEEQEFIRKSNININSSLEELRSEVFSLLNKENTDSNTLLTLKKILFKIDNVDLSKYVKIAFIQPPYSDSVLYEAISDTDKVRIGDCVIIKRKDSLEEGIVSEIGYYKEHMLPVSYDNLYEIVEVTDRDSDIDNF